MDNKGQEGSSGDTGSVFTAKTCVVSEVSRTEGELRERYLGTRTSGVVFNVRRIL